MHMHQEDSSSVSGFACALMPASLQVILLIRMMCDRADSLSQLMGVNNFLARHHFTNVSSCCYSCQCTLMVSEAPEGPLLLVPHCLVLRICMLASNSVQPSLSCIVRQVRLLFGLHLDDAFIEVLMIDLQT